ncbi:MAG: hypothetical protein AAB649_04970 [Patescibacteria group bacterium]
MPQSGFNYDMVASIGNFLLECFHKVQVDHADDIRAGLALKRSRMAKEFASDLAGLGGDSRITHASLQMADAFFERLQKLPDEQLGDIDFISKFLQEGDTLRGVQGLHIASESIVEGKVTQFV